MYFKCEQSSRFHVSFSNDVAVLVGLFCSSHI